MNYFNKVRQCEWPHKTSLKSANVKFQWSGAGTAPLSDWTDFSCSLRCSVLCILPGLCPVCLWMLEQSGNKSLDCSGGSSSPALDSLYLQTLGTAVSLKPPRYWSLSVLQIPRCCVPGRTIVLFTKAGAWMCPLPDWGRFHPETEIIWALLAFALQLICPEQDSCCML